MMGTALVITFGQLLSLVVLVMIGLIAWLWLHKKKQEARPAFLDAQLETNHAVSTGPLRAEIASLRDQVAKLGQEVEALKATRGAAPQANYTHAIELARQGHPVAEVAHRCGISRAEAELIVAMHGGNHKT